MVGMIAKETSRWWWIDSNNSSKRSPWLQSTLSELDAKTKAMLKVIEEDADSFAQRAEMYYKKRPELITMVEDFYRAHRSLAERYDHVRSEHGSRLVATLGSPFATNTYNLEKSPFSTHQTYDTCSVTCESDDYAESEVEDPEQECISQYSKESEEAKDCPSDGGSQVGEERKEEVISVSIAVNERNDEVEKLREEMERLREENRIQKEQLAQKDEEKREVIRQLSVAVDMLKEENSKLKKSTIAQKSPKKSWSPFEFKKLKEGFIEKLVNGSAKPHSRLLTF